MKRTSRFFRILIGIGAIASAATAFIALPQEAVADCVWCPIPSEYCHCMPRNEGHGCGGNYCYSTYQICCIKVQ